VHNYLLKAEQAAKRRRDAEDCRYLLGRVLSE
jgi:hypothetical protein